jgi:thermostable 8-oxoguanine DNA glycosylase
MDTKSERLRDACEQALQAFRKFNDSDFDDIISNLEFCIGSYSFDLNPSGLVEFGYKALDMLKEIKKTHPRKISKDLLNALEDSLT